MCACVGGRRRVTEFDKAEAEGRPFDFIFMDFVMPTMNGPAAARDLRRRGYGGPIIGVTGNVLSEDVEEFTTAGANEVLGKPVRALQLREILRAEKYNTQRR